MYFTLFFSYYVAKYRMCFYTYNTSQFVLATFQSLYRLMWVEATILDTVNI